MVSGTRRVVLEAVAHRPPAGASGRPDSFYDLAFDLVDVFHHGYIEIHDQPPMCGTNPFFDEYAPLLDPDTDLLKWSREIARGDHKNGESHRLGRIFARAYLSLHGYRWFPDVSDLLKSPERGWSAKRPKVGGNMPDWLVGDSDRFAVAEAKGTHSSIHQASKVLANSWRPQVTNIEVRRNGTPTRLKGWIVATRWVTSAQKRVDPKMYAEDPEIPGEPLGNDDTTSLNTWLARVHTMRNLRRLGRSDVAQRLAAVGALREGVPPVRPVTWRCAAPGLGRMRFVGRPIGPLPAVAPWLSIDWRLLQTLEPFARDNEAWERWERWARIWEATLDDALEAVWFDGVAVPVLTALAHDHLPSLLPEIEAGSPERPNVSLLPDGSLLAPMSLMKPVEREEI